MKKLIQLVSKIVLFIALLNVFAFAVVHVHEGGQKLGVFTQPLKSFAAFPKVVLNTFENIKKPERLVPIDPGFETTNKLDYDLYAVSSHYDKTQWIIRLINLKNDSLQHQWFLKKENYKNTGRVFSHAEPREPILLANKSVIFACDESYNLYKLDKKSNILWHNKEHHYHHTINLDYDKNIWTCTKRLTALSSLNLKYWDDYLTKIDSETGKTIFNKSISEILFENDLSYFIHGLGNGASTENPDPLHLNDIEPVLNDGEYWKKGDLFLSIRHKSLILLYRPSMNKVMRVIQGAFYNQHDIDIESDSIISLFNNNVSSLSSYRNADNTNFTPIINESDSLLNSITEILLYNLRDSTFTVVYKQQFLKEKIFTNTQGLHEFLSNGDLFVESQNSGKLYIVNDKEFLLKRYINEPKDEFVEPPHWIRLYENINFIK